MMPTNRVMEICHVKTIGQTLLRNAMKRPNFISKRIRSYIEDQFCSLTIADLAQSEELKGFSFKS